MFRFSRTLWFPFIALILVTGCTPAHLRQIENKTYKETYRSEAIAVLDGTGDVNKVSPRHRLTPLMAAIMIQPERVQELIDAGANVHYVRPASGSSIIHSAVLRERMHTTMWPDHPYRITADLEIMEALLKAGADPNAVNATFNDITPAHVVANPAYTRRYDNTWLEMQKKRIALLVQYGADLSIKDTNGMTPYETSLADSPHAYTQAQTDAMNRFSQFLYFAEHYGIEQAKERIAAKLAAEAEHQRQQAAAEAERKRQQEIAKQVVQHKRAIIKQAFTEQADLQAAIASLRELARPCFTLGDAENEIRNFNCGTLINDNYYPSPSCETYQGRLHRTVKEDEEQACAPYKRKVDELASVFGRNQGLAKREIRQQIGDVSRVSSLASLYDSQIRTMDDVRNKEARGQRAAEQRAFQQGMNNLMKHAENAFGSKTVADQIIEQSVRDTQRTLYAIGNSRKMAEINANLAAVNRQLEKAENTATAAQPSSAPTIPVSRPESDRKICAGPFTMPAIDMVLTTVEYNKGLSSQKFECPEGSTAIQEGAADYVNVTWSMPARSVEPAGKNKVHVSRDAFRYECLCSSGKKTGTRSTQQ